MTEQQNNQPEEGQRHRKRKTESFKHVEVEHRRPQLTREGDQKGQPSQKRRSGGRRGQGRRRQGAKATAHAPMLKVAPLGGLDAIGKNMTVFECAGDLIVDDAGLMFPDDDHPGVDLILPDYTYILERADNLRGIVITHGHEDHTGTLPYLLKDIDRKVDIYGTKLTLGLIEGKFAEHKVTNANLVEIKPGQQVKLGCFTCDFFAVNHSIPGAVGVFLQSPAGNVLHTGDFKLDQTPIDGVTPNYNAINAFGAEGVDLLLSDSTNATRPGFTNSEAAVGPTLRHIIKNAPGRVFVASFSSHIHRLQQICDASVSVGRKVVVTGRSMITNTKIARELGYLKISDRDIIDAYDVDRIPDDRIVVLCTGSQGEPLSALSRMANGEHKSLSIRSSDTVIISATPVPGNEKSVTSIINSLSKLGCDIHDKSNGLVHVSGHGSQEELKLVMAMAKPTYFMPVHGEAMHLRAHAKLGEQMGIRSKNIFIMDNGDSLEMRAHKVSRGAGIDSGVVYVDGLSVTDANPVVLRDRQKLAQDGIITCVVALTGKKRRIDVIEISSRGVSFATDDELMADARKLVENTISRLVAQKNSSLESLRKDVRSALSGFVWSRTHTRPMVIPVVMEV